jgi:hypothetical protein
MYRWYRNSSVCCIYLADVPGEPQFENPFEYLQAIQRSRWLTRGWTLQELLAQRGREFYSMNWELIALESEYILEAISEETG